MKKKICLILIVSLLFAFMVGSKCFANPINTYAFNYNGNTYILPDELTNNYTEFTLLKDSHGCFYLMGYNQNAICINGGLNIIVTGDVNLYSKSYSISNLLSFSDSTAENVLAIGSSSANTFSGSYRDLECIFTTTPIYLFDSNYHMGELLFNTNTNSFIFNYTDLYSAYSNTSLSGVLSEIISLLPAVLIVIISFIGIRKGISFIRSILRKS